MRILKDGGTEVAENGMIHVGEKKLKIDQVIKNIFFQKSARKLRVGMY